MRKYFILLVIFILCTAYIFVVRGDSKKEVQSEGDPPILEYKAVNLGGTVDNPRNDYISISNIQTAYVRYTKDEIDFDRMINESMHQFKWLLNYPFNPLPGYMFSVGYDENSKTQFYYQSNKEETRTVILKVVYDEEEKENEVIKLYDGDYFKLVSVNLENPNELLAYDGNHDEFVFEVN